jgi:hypothetical protein
MAAMNDTAIKVEKPSAMSNSNAVSNGTSANENGSNTAEDVGMDALPSVPLSHLMCAVRIMFRAVQG